MVTLLCRHPPEEEGEEGVEYADGMRWHPPPEQPGRRVPVDAAVDLQQGVAFVVVLSQEQRRHPLSKFTGRQIKEAL